MNCCPINSLLSQYHTFHRFKICKKENKIAKKIGFLDQLILIKSDDCADLISGFQKKKLNKWKILDSPKEISRLIRRMILNVNDIAYFKLCRMLHIRESQHGKIAEIG